MILRWFDRQCSRATSRGREDVRIFTRLTTTERSFPGRQIKSSCEVKICADVAMGELLCPAVSTCRGKGDHLKLFLAGNGHTFLPKIWRFPVFHPHGGKSNSCRQGNKIAIYWRYARSNNTICHWSFNCLAGDFELPYFSTQTLYQLSHASSNQP